MGLHCCKRAFSSCREQGLLFVVVSRLPLGFSCCGARALEHRLSSCGARAYLLRDMWDFSRTRAQTRVPCIGRRILNHCATREALHFLMLWEYYENASVLVLFFPSLPGGWCPNGGSQNTCMSKIDVRLPQGFHSDYLHVKKKMQLCFKMEEAEKSDVPVQLDREHF